MDQARAPVRTEMPAPPRASTRHPLLDVDVVEQAPDAYLAEVGRIFAVFNGHTQDSGNVSHGVQVAPDRYFEKTAGRSDDPKPLLNYADACR